MITKISRYEKFLAALSPQRALNRYASRVQLGLAERAYENVDTTRLRKKNQDMRSSDQINALATDKLRFQGRYLDENYDVAKSVLDTLVASIVGEGIQSFPMMRLTGGDMAEDANKILAMLWEEWSRRPEVTNEMSWPEVQQLTARTLFRDGEMFTQRLRGNVPGMLHSSSVLLSLELTEADFCPIGLFDDGNSSGVGSGNRVRQGVEKNAWGAPQAYWFWKTYPTELATNFAATIISASISQQLALNSTNLNRISAENMIHMKMVDRVRQTRGNSIFASVYSRLMDLKDYEESERVAARIGAAFAFAITKGIDSAGAATPSEDRWREMDIVPGIIADNLGAGEKVESLKNERPSNLIKDFRTTQLQSVAGGTGANFSSVSKQYDGSYSSQRQELMESHQNYRTVRARFVSNFVDVVYRDFVIMAITQGLVPIQGVDPLTIFKAEHLGSGVPYIDPKREVEADEARVAAGFRSRHQTILERGGNPEDTFRLIVEETERDDEEGISFTTSAIKAGAEVVPGAVETTLDEPVDEENMLTSVGPYKVGRRYEDGKGDVFVYTVDGFQREVEA